MHGIQVSFDVPGRQSSAHCLRPCSRRPPPLSYMAPACDGYDRRLLAQAPAATRAQLQQGYDSVLLAPNRREKQAESDLALNESVARHEKPAALSRSCWQGRGKAILGLLIALVVIAAIVVGAVGATARKKRSPLETADVETGALSSGVGSQSGIFVLPPATSSSKATASKSLSLDSVAVMTQPVAVSGVFPQVTPHFVTARRR
ncbi:hypothetical protein B0H17DRAFT_435460 [Mycena rosella]|uniref:Uncharacterized protein n=1 Tax=Mycena rosella TaxID=1033263 RepID=A0AAD7FZZ5_MYCRO|nr:hypothetical protein B0H17DRAFT_435460 [Mycena rosella]